MKNNLDLHLQWLEQSRAFVPKKPVLQDITVAVNATVNTTQGNTIQAGRLEAGTPVRESSNEFSPLLSNVEKSTRKSSGLRLARRENSTLKSSGSTSSTSKHSSPQPATIPAPQHQYNQQAAIIRQTIAPAVIDLTFDDEMESTPIIPKKRPQTEPIPTPLLISKRQRDHNDFTSDDFDDTELNEALDQHEIRRQTSYNAVDVTVGSNSTTEKSFNAPEPVRRIPNPTQPQPKAKPPIHEPAPIPAQDQSNIISAARRSTSITASKLVSESELLKAQQLHIELCEKRIDLLVKRNIINESTALSEDEKKRKRNELSAELVALAKEQNKSKKDLSQLKLKPPSDQIQSVPPVQREPSLPAPSVPLRPQFPPPSMPALNPMTSNLQSSRANMEVLQSSRDPREIRKNQEPQQFESVNSDLEDLDDSLIVNNYHRPSIRRSNNIEEEQEDLSFAGDGLVTSQINPEDQNPNTSDREFVAEDDQGSEDGEYEDADDMPNMESENNNFVVDRREVEDLANSSDEDEDRVENGEDHLRNRYKSDDENEEDEIIGSDDDELQEVGHSAARRFSQIYSEDLEMEEDEDDDVVAPTYTYNEEREATNNPQDVIDLDLEFESIDADTSYHAPPPAPREPAQRPQQQFQAPPTPPRRSIVNEDDFSNTLQSSPFADELDDGVEEIGNPVPEIPPSEIHEWTPEVFDKLKQIFKLSSFRHNQLEAVNATLSGKDTFVLMPTGGGKSLCYQLPAVVKSGVTHGTTIVVSPLISLMQDQVEHLWEKNIKAGMINSKGSPEERRTTFNLFVDGFLDLVYLSPEMISASNQAKNAIDRLYRQGKLARIVVDEAHCVSSWGHDFRPDYKHLSYFKTNYPEIPVMALTATANDHVKMDIIHNLNLKDPVFLKQSFNRTNLFYEVLNKDKDHMKKIEMSILGKFKDETGIIYCHSKNACEQTSEKLNNSGIKCAFYHAGMTPEDRLDIQKAWQNGTIKVICATIAFGMGIDKADVRFVIHLTLPRTLEGYYQETGRAGRDGNYSYCTMFYGFRDARTLQNMISRDKDLDKAGKEKHLTKLRQVIQYCENSTDCRRQQVLQYFNEQFHKDQCEKNCDNCKKGSDASSKFEKDVTEYAKKMTELVRSIEHEKVTLIYCQDVFKGSKSNKITQAGHDELSEHGAGRELEKVDIERIAFHLIAEKILEEFSVFNKAGFASSYIKIGSEAHKLLNNRKKIVMTFFTNSKRTRPGSANTNAALNRAPSNSTPASRSKTLNRDNINEFRYNDNDAIGAARGASFTSARQELQRSTSNLQHQPSVSTPIRLGELSFESSQEKRDYSRAFLALREARDKTMSILKVSASTSVASDRLLKTMARKLPQTEHEFQQLENFENEVQKGYFNYFKVVLQNFHLRNGAQKTPSTAARSKSIYFNNQQRVEEEAENTNVINQLRQSQRPSNPSASQTINQTSTQSRKRKNSSQSGGRYKKYSKKRSTYSKSNGGNKTNGNSNGNGRTSVASSQKSKKVAKRPTQSAMPL